MHFGGLKTSDVDELRAIFTHALVGAFEAALTNLQLLMVTRQYHISDVNFSIRHQAVPTV